MGTDRLLAALAVIAVLGGAGVAEAYCRLTTGMPTPGRGCSEAGTPLAWERQCISYSLVERERTSPGFDAIADEIDASFETWMKVRCDGEPFPVQLMQTEKRATCSEPEHNPKGANANAIFFVEDWVAEGLPGQAFGLTLVWHDPDTGEIFDADMELNEDMGEFAICDTRCETNQVDLRNVVTHEAGHFLGLGHSSSPTASMYGESLVGETLKRMLNSDDREGICAIYGHLEPFSCEAKHFEPRGGFARGCFVPEEGCSLSVAGGQGRHGGPLAPLALALAGLVLRILYRKRTK